MRSPSRAIAVLAVALCAACATPGPSTPTRTPTHEPASGFSPTPTVRPETEQNYLLEVEVVSADLTSNDQLPIDIGYGVCGRTKAGWPDTQLSERVKATAAAGHQVLSTDQANTVLADARGYLCPN